MPIKLEHGSASSIQLFSECPAKWSVNYDQDLKTYSRSNATDKGTILHKTLEIWNNPEKPVENTYEALVGCLVLALAELGYAEPYPLFKECLDALKKIYALEFQHPTIPMHLASTIAVEQSINGFQLDNWPLPMWGSIDRLLSVCVNPDETMKIALVVKDYKSGRPKTHTQLTQDDIQPVLYLCWVLTDYVPYLKSLGYEITQVSLVWTYLNDNVSVNMYQDDFDLDAFALYVQTISKQMLDFVDAYNKVEEQASYKNGIEATEITQDFIQQYEKINSYCSYCPRKNICGTFQRSLVQEQVIDITSPDTSMEEIWKARETFSAMAAHGDRKRKEIDDLLRIHLDQTNQQSLFIGEREVYANQEERHDNKPETVIEILGKDFVMRNATITQVAIDNEIARIALTDKEGSNAKFEMLKAMQVTRPGPRVVRSRAIKAVKVKK